MDKSSNPIAGTPVSLGPIHQLPFGATKGVPNASMLSSSAGIFVSYSPIIQVSSSLMDGIIKGISVSMFPMNQLPFSPIVGSPAPDKSMSEKSIPDKSISDKSAPDKSILDKSIPEKSISKGIPVSMLPMLQLPRSLI